MTISDFINNLNRIMPERGSYHIIDEKKLFAEKKAILVEAHADDKALAEGLDIKLARKGVGIIIVTFTDGGARFGKENDGRLVRKRIEENNKSAKISEAAMVINLGYPDGELHTSESQAIDSFEKVIADVNPDFVIAPHEFDEHKDHASAFRIVKKVVNGSLPLYAMDTISGESVVPTHYFPLSEEEKRIRDEAYLAHESQVTNLPAHEMQAVNDVLNMPQKRGEERNMRYAGIAVKDANGNESDPIVDILGEEILVAEFVT